MHYAGERISIRETWKVFEIKGLKYNQIKYGFSKETYLPTNMQCWIFSSCDVAVYCNEGRTSTLLHKNI